MNPRGPLVLAAAAVLISGDIYPEMNAIDMFWLNMKYFFKDICWDV